MKDKTLLFVLILVGSSLACFFVSLISGQFVYYYSNKGNFSLFLLIAVGLIIFVGGFATGYFPYIFLMSKNSEINRDKKNLALLFSLILGIVYLILGGGIIIGIMFLLSSSMAPQSF